MALLMGAPLVLVALLSGCQPEAGPTQCPIVNISILEGASEITVANVSSYTNSFHLCKQNHSSSVCQPIASIGNGNLTFFSSVHMPYFSVSKDSLKVLNATSLLIGEYQLRTRLGEDCLQRFFLDVHASGSNRTYYTTIAAVTATASLLMVGGFALWWKQRRRRRDIGNESLHPGASETDGTRIYTSSGEYEIAVNGIVVRFSHPSPVMA